LLNLLSNAFKFTPDGGEIVCELAEADENLTFSIRDNGPGIPEAMRQAVFERFRQLDGGTDRRFGGTGLGLAIVSDLVAMHGGSIEVQPVKPHGAKFVFKVRRWHETSHTPAEITEPGLADQGRAARAVQALRMEMPRVAEQADREEPGGKPVILLAEDNRSMNDFIASS